MAQANPFDQFDSAPAPANNAPPPFISGTISPTKQAAEQRDEVRTNIAVEGNNRSNRDEGRTVETNQFNKEDKLRADFSGNLEVKAYRAALPMLSQALRAPKTGQGDLSVIYAYAKLMDPTSVVREGEMDMVTASSPWAQKTIQGLQNQLDGSGRLPEATRRGLEQEMIRTTQARRKSYDSQYNLYRQNAQSYGLNPDLIVGPHDGEAFREDMQAYDRERGLGRFKGAGATSNNGGGGPNGGIALPEMRGGFEKGTQVRLGADAWSDNQEPFNREEYLLKTYGVTPEQERWVVGFWNANAGNQNLTVEGVRNAFQEAGVPTTTYDDQTIAAQIDRARKGLNASPFDTSGAEAEYKARLDQFNQKFDGGIANNPDGAMGYTDRLKSGVTAGLRDEAAGIGGFIGALLTGDNPSNAYRFQRDADRRLQQQERDAQGFGGDALEFVGNIGSARGLPGSGSVGEAVRGGGMIGAINGFGQGQGLGNSTVNALIGGGVGAATGGAVQKGVNALANRPQAAVRDATGLAQDAQAEGITLNRAIVDPRSNNRVSGVDSSLVGGPRFQAGMQKIEGQIEGRVQNLGNGGTAMNEVSAGQAYQAAGERFIKKSGRRAKKLYDNAEKLAGDTKVTPTQALAKVDDAIARLSETPTTNATEIDYLEGLKSDLSKDLSVGALRRMRTTLRKKISKGDLVFGEDEARVLGVMDAASNDIRAGLIQQGKGAAAKAFDKADTEYSDRMEYITETLQKIIGKRGSNISAEQVARNLSGMARGKDTEGVGKFLATLTPDERADVSATFAQALGTNTKGEFTVTQFLRQTSEKNFPNAALRVIFGDEGAASIARLRNIGGEVERVTSAMNSRTSKTGVANDYRSWLLNLIVGAAPSLATGNATTAIGGALTLGGAKAGRDILNARSLLSSDISKWLVSAPKTTSPKAINAHISRLAAIAGKPGPVQMDAQQIMEYLTGAAKNSTTAAAASDEKQN